MVIVRTEVQVKSCPIYEQIWGSVGEQVPVPLGSPASTAGEGMAVPSPASAMNRAVAKMICMFAESKLQEQETVSGYIKKIWIKIEGGR